MRYMQKATELDAATVDDCGPCIGVSALPSALYPVSMPKKKPVRIAVLDAAIDLVESSGAAVLTLDAVAARAGVSKGGLLHHFKSKEALLKGMMARVAEDFDLQSKEAAAKLNQGTGNSAARQFDLLRTYLDRSFSGIGTKDRSAMALFAVAANQPSLLEPVRDFFAKRVKETLGHSENPAASLALMLLADGLWLFDALDIAPFSGKLREQARDMAIEWARQISEVPAVKKKPGATRSQGSK